MTVSRAQLDAFRAEVEKLGAQGASYVETYLSAMQSAYPELTVAECRELAIEAVEDALSAYGAESAAAACAYFDALAAQAGSAITAVNYGDAIDRDMLTSRAHALAGKLVSGDVRGFNHWCGELSRYYIKRSAFENVRRNCDARGLRYARVPSGLETCAFCFMLASRGFVYWSRESAGDGGAYHRHCDCVIVPGFDGLGQDVQVEGYKPSELYERYLKVVDDEGLEPERVDGDAFRRKALAALKKRNYRWLWSGEGEEMAEEAE